MPVSPEGDNHSQKKVLGFINSQLTAMERAVQVLREKRRTGWKIDSATKKIYKIRKSDNSEG